MNYKTRSEIISSVLYLSDLPQGGYKERLYSCKALILHPDFSDFLILRSYSTVVAVYQYSTKILWVFDFYSHTTVSHIAKFKNWIRYKYQTGWNYPCIVHLYNDSRTSKRDAQKNLDNDFASVIATALNQR